MEFFQKNAVAFSALGIMGASALLIVLVNYTFPCTEYKVVASIQRVRGSSSSLVFEDGSTKTTTSSGYGVGDKLCTQNTWRWSR